MQRYFIPAEQLREQEAVITDDDARHLARVLRAKPGERVIISDGESREALAEIVAIDERRVTVSIIETLPMSNEPNINIWVAQSLPKGDKLELVIQKGTEIGVSRFIPFMSERSVVRYDERKEGKRADRWRKIAKEAAEQAHRNRIPTIEPPLAWASLLKQTGQADAAFICYEQERDRMIGNALRKLDSIRTAVTSGSRPSILIIVGPEGGFSEREAREAIQAGCVPIGLGHTILRTETAALVAATCILYEFGQIGG